MALFQYPKTKHSRSLKPRQFKRYKTYKRYLQFEFSRVCVYCRQPDSSAPNLNFGVDHYRPKGLAKFASLICSYDNLYYCCGSCNSRKNNDWPLDEIAGPYVVNPCDYVMANHLRFDATTGKIVFKDPDGKHTERLLQLNDPATVQYRLNTLKIVQHYQSEVAKEESMLKAVDAEFKKGKIDQNQYGTETQEIQTRLADARSILLAQTGGAPVPPIPRIRNGLHLV